MVIRQESQGLRYNPRKDGLERWLGPTETLIMEVAWTLGPRVTVKQVWEYIYENERKLAYTTCMTTMLRLSKKGILPRKRRKGENFYLYTPRDVDAHAFVEREMRCIIQSLELSASELVELLRPQQRAA